ncbi:ArnT family glycosyltransferase [Thalassoroseus pseudoceratinae]|nr:glycosyltransferase family 39 protein [Thalassoroseus pseudoceratinae]
MRIRCAFPLRNMASPSDGGPVVSARRVLIALFLLCLIPRLVMIFRVGPVCNDGYYYTSVAAAFEDGEFAQVFAYLNLNIYPMILSGLHRLGLEWLLAAKLWGAVISSLAVLPIFGWIRRMFDDRIATLSGFLYAIHPEFIELSVEPIREPTFWFLLALSFYLGYRATTESRLRFFVLGGLAMAFAVHTRSEGWLLLGPILIWTAFNAWDRRAHLGKLACGTGLWLAMTPLLILVINLTVLQGETGWQWGRLTHFQLGWQWVQTALEPAPAPATPTALTAASVPILPQPITVPVPQPSVKSTPKQPEEPAPTVNQESKKAKAEPLSTGKRFQKFFHAWIRMFEPVNFSMAVIGLFVAATQFWRRDYWVLLVFSMTVLAAVWVLFGALGVISSRYFLPTYLALVPFAAIGMWSALAWWSRQVLRITGSRRLRRTVVPCAIALGISLGWTDAFTTWHETREAEAAMAENLRTTIPRVRSVTVDLHAVRVGYHLINDVPHITPEAIAHGVNQTFCERQNRCPNGEDIVILSCHRFPEEQIEALRNEAIAAGLTPIEYQAPPMAHGQFLVFVHKID